MHYQGRIDPPKAGRGHASLHTGMHITWGQCVLVSTVYTGCMALSPSSVGRFAFDIIYYNYKLIILINYNSHAFIHLHTLILGGIVSLIAVFSYLLSILLQPVLSDGSWSIPPCIDHQVRSDIGNSVGPSSGEVQDFSRVHFKCNRSCFLK